MSKRPSIDLSALTSQVAEPMHEAAQRTPDPVKATVQPKAPVSTPKQASRKPDEFKTENLIPLAFKVSKQFHKRFKTVALSAELKMVELLYEALDAWENKAGKKYEIHEISKSRKNEKENA